jgi:hypothetical protein
MYDFANKTCHFAPLEQKLGFVYHHTTEEIELSLLGEIRTGHVMLLTRENWETNRQYEKN